MGSGCPFCNESKGEKSIRTIFDNLGIRYIRQWTHDAISHRRYDFYTFYNNSHWLIEYDGKQHFEKVPFFHKEEKEFLRRQEIDMIKTFIACNTGYKLIRIDHTVKDEEIIKHHILEAFKRDSPIYYSNDIMYEWLSKGMINRDILKMESPSIWYKFCN